MRFSILSVALLSAAAGGVFADDSLDKIVEKMPGCAVSCYADACNKSGCSPEDFKCVCNSLVRLPARMGNCLGKNSCTNYNAQDSLENVCSRMDKNPSATEVSAASSVVAHAIATATPTKPSNAGAKDMAAMGGVLGAAIAVAAVI
ncbi:hypothetical protein PG999_008315 [Apiospora kogelbergensis]|uniref:CFEM domain-containing protein n=1 Tax=Apiospora kogelbergensis TaxID=1337665 RepID=A0AAW0QR28_9PEZI